VQSFESSSGMLASTAFDKVIAMGDFGAGLSKHFRRCSFAA
jgi:hypothetical protein